MHTNIREDLKIPLTMLSISFLNKLPFKGSYNGKRFIFEKAKSEDSTDANDNTFKLKVSLWKDLFCYEKTASEDMIVEYFDYSKSGIEEGLNFIESTSLDKLK